MRWCGAALLACLVCFVLGLKKIQRQVRAAQRARSRTGSLLQENIGDESNLPIDAKMPRAGQNRRERHDRGWLAGGSDIDR
mmetsp:Transcript_5727/g.16515  ORF Transcript_5727/g.16515 Transcript_5727/m.16515 type:complete len:81 (+) Transcript_5727:1528-1770(+)